MNTKALMARLRVTLNSEEHPPEVWNMYAHKLVELSRKAHSRIVVGEMGERVSDSELGRGKSISTK